MKSNYISFEERKEIIMKEYTLIPYTYSSRLFSTVRRMKAEKELHVPMNQRACFAISVETGHRANEMNNEKWNKFYDDLTNQLKADYPEIYNRLFSPMEKFCDRCGVKVKGHYRGWWMVCGALYGKYKGN